MATRGPITVLHTRIVSGTGGGPDKTIVNSPRHLIGTRYRAVAAFLHAPGDPGIGELERRARQAECPFLAIPDAHPVDLRTLARMAELCRELDVKIWHGHDYKSNLFGVLLERLCDLKLATTVHGWVKLTHKTPLYFAIDRFALRRYHDVMAVSQDLFDACLDAGVPQGRLSLIENGIDTHAFRRRGPARDSARRSSSRDRVVIGAVGRLSEEKGFHWLIEAAERALERGVALELWIAGEGDQKERLAAQIAASPHARHFRLLGFEREPVELYEALDLFALSSLREGLPNVVLEAMAMEVPVLATRCGGMEAFARDTEDALLVEAGSAEALANGIVRLAQDAALRTRLAATARARVERECSFAHRIAREVERYDRLLER